MLSMGFTVRQWDYYSTLHTLLHSVLHVPGKWAMNILPASYEKGAFQHLGHERREGGSREGGGWRDVFTNKFTRLTF